MNKNTTPDGGHQALPRAYTDYSPGGELIPYRFTPTPVEALDALRDSKITAQAYAVLAVMMRFRQPGGWCWMTVEFLASQVQLAPHTTRKHLHILMAAGFVERQHVSVPDPENPRNRTGSRFWLQSFKTGDPLTKNVSPSRVTPHEKRDPSSDPLTVNAPSAPHENHEAIEDGFLRKRETPVRIDSNDFLSPPEDENLENAGLNVDLIGELKALALKYDQSGFADLLEEHRERILGWVAPGGQFAGRVERLRNAVIATATRIPPTKGKPQGIPDPMGYLFVLVRDGIKGTIEHESNAKKLRAKAEVEKRLKNWRLFEDPVETSTDEPSEHTPTSPQIDSDGRSTSKKTDHAVHVIKRPAKPLYAPGETRKFWDPDFQPKELAATKEQPTATNKAPALRELTDEEAKQLDPERYARQQQRREEQLARLRWKPIQAEPSAGG